MTLDPTSWPDGGGGSGGGELLALTVHVSSAAILALDNVTPLLLLAAPGAGTAIYPLHYFAAVTGTTPYTAGLSAQIVVAANQNGPSLLGIGDVLTSSPPAWGTFTAGQSFGALTDAEDEPLYLHASSAPVGGDLDLDLTIYYVLVDV